MASTGLNFSEDQVKFLAACFKIGGYKTDYAAVADEVGVTKNASSVRLVRIKKAIEAADLTMSNAKAGAEDTVSPKKTSATKPHEGGKRKTSDGEGEGGTKPKKSRKKMKGPVSVPPEEVIKKEPANDDDVDGVGDLE